MASITPTQERVVDPFASYNSNIVNKISEVVSHGTNGMLTVPSLGVARDVISPTTTVVVAPGYVIKDDVLIKVTAEHKVDFEDSDQYVGSPITTTGNYYVVLTYTYQKQRPAPQAKIQILKPDQRGLLLTNPAYLLLKVVSVNVGGSSLVIEDLYDSDPELGYRNNEREYLKYYAGGVTHLPTFQKSRDQGRLTYESDRNKFFFGYDAEWSELTAGGVTVDINTDSTGVFNGQLCYVDSIGNATPAEATDTYKAADLSVLSIGSGSTGIGQGIVSGYVQGVPVEHGLLISVGDILYLSESSPGTVTNIRTHPLYQVVGRALTSASSTTPVDMIFSPKLMMVISESGQITTWGGPDSSGLYYNVLDVKSLDGTGVYDCTWFDDNTNTQIIPAKVEILAGGDYIKVYFSVDNLVVNYMIQSPVSTGGAAGGGGGGGGVSDHALLLNLEYANAGHTGFAPDPHGNAAHVGTYIQASGVTFGNLNANGDVGDGAAQVPQGTHTHAVGDSHNYNDVPSGSIILFDADASVVGYTLLTDQEDMLVYITKGSGALGEAGGSLKPASTWTQPNHHHSITGAISHTHTTTGHTLTVSEMPSHTHTYKRRITSTTSGIRSGSVSNVLLREYDQATTSTGSGNSHNHGNTGSSGIHDHGGNSGNNGTANSWRPRGRNFTRQQKI